MFPTLDVDTYKEGIQGRDTDGLRLIIGDDSEKVVMGWGQRGWKKNITSRFEQAITRKVAGFVKYKNYHVIFKRGLSGTTRLKYGIPSCAGLTSPVDYTCRS